MDIKKTTHKMDDLGKTLMLLFVIVLIASIVMGVFNEYRMKKTEIDFTSGELKEAYIEGCMEGGEGLVSTEYCECHYKYITDNYTSKEILQMMTEGFEGKYSPSLEDANEVCRDQL